MAPIQAVLAFVDRRQKMDTSSPEMPGLLQKYIEKTGFDVPDCAAADALLPALAGAQCAGLPYPGTYCMEAAHLTEVHNLLSFRVHMQFGSRTSFCECSVQLVFCGGPECSTTLVFAWASAAAVPKLPKLGANGCFKTKKPRSSNEIRWQRYVLPLNAPSMLVGMVVGFGPLCPTWESQVDISEWALGVCMHAAACHRHAVAITLQLRQCGRVPLDLLRGMLDSAI